VEDESREEYLGGFLFRKGLYRRWLKIVSSFLSIARINRFTHRGLSSEWPGGYSGKKRWKVRKKQSEKRGRRKTF